MVPDGGENGSNAAKAEGMIKNSAAWRRKMRRRFSCANTENPECYCRAQRWCESSTQGIPTFHYRLSQAWSSGHPCWWCLLCGKMAGTQATNLKRKQPRSEEKMLLCKRDYLTTSLVNKETDRLDHVFLDLGGIWLLSASLQLSKRFRIEQCWWHFLHIYLRQHVQSQTGAVDSLSVCCNTERTRLTDLWERLEQSSQQTRVTQLCCSSDRGMKVLL